MPKTSFQRARSEEQKQERASALLDAARSLAAETGVASVTLTAMADRAGIHHSAVRRYYSSFKQVLLLLGEEGWQRWAGGVCDELQAAEQVSPAAIAQVMAKHFAGDPLFCDLLVNLSLHLEREVEVEQVAAFRQVAYDSIRSVAEATQRVCRLFDEESAFDAIAAAVSLAAMFWQNAHPPKELAEAIGDDILSPNWNMDFLPALTRVLAATCVGLAIRSVDSL
ncbi:TetR family transcriptional regulator [Mycobacteroides abscessus subsp. bolletii]|uniref:TetR family transcriptional regulator n=1 Tax=Mycobacteroides abscessus TaxID=36809 RepID=UPI0019D0BF2B|nr:TetR family transcriptional regulator [Mycobacteroides abscessus]MBN7304810.1 TetR family transcriptional regulator [Mycobacteroides abscessus subsp. bolletii]